MRLPLRVTPTLVTPLKVGNKYHRATRLARRPQVAMHRNCHLFYTVADRYAHFSCVK